MKRRYDFKFSSSLAPFIKGLIEEKRASGYLYNSSAFELKNFDTFCLNNGFTGTTITKGLADAWSLQRPNEGTNSRNIRVGLIRELSKYMMSLGVDAYTQRRLLSTETKIAHVFSEEERRAFFTALDNLPSSPYYGSRLLKECQVIFRLYYCCGMRRSEALMLTWQDVDFEKATLRIVQSKGDKDRLVYLTDDVLSMLEKYLAYIQQELPQSQWVFPGAKADNPINEVTVRAWFIKTWSDTPYANISNPPTIKSFRHTFVVDRLNAWMADGVDIQSKIPFLCKYLGHSSINESLYYYHQVSESFKIVRQRDKTSIAVIPEVTPYE